jgi:anoctamin-10
VKLIEALNNVGLSTEVRYGDNCSLLVFVKVASDRHLQEEVYRSRIQDWLYSVRAAAPEKEIQSNLDHEPVTEAERLRLVYLLITKPTNEGGAGITPTSGEWKDVASIFALHYNTFNKECIKKFSSK